MAIPAALYVVLPVEVRFLLWQCWRAGPSPAIGGVVICPECDSTIRGEECASCGWTRPVTRPQLTQPHDRTLAAILQAKAQREAEEGLAQHGLSRKPDEPMPEYIARLSVGAKQLAGSGQVYPGKDWAFRLRSRVADGEKVSSRAKECMEAFFAGRT